MQLESDGGGDVDRLSFGSRQSDSSGTSSSTADDELDGVQPSASQRATKREDKQRVKAVLESATQCRRLLEHHRTLVSRQAAPASALATALEHQQVAAQSLLDDLASQLHQFHLARMVAEQDVQRAYEYGSLATSSFPDAHSLSPPLNSPSSSTKLRDDPPALDTHGLTIQIAQLEQRISTDHEQFALERQVLLGRLIASIEQSVDVPQQDDWLDHSPEADGTIAVRTRDDQPDTHRDGTQAARRARNVPSTSSRSHGDPQSSSTVPSGLVSSPWTSTSAAPHTPLPASTNPSQPAASVAQVTNDQRPQPGATRQPVAQLELDSVFARELQDQLLAELRRLQAHNVSLVQTLTNQRKQASQTITMLQAHLATEQAQHKQTVDLHQRTIADQSERLQSLQQAKDAHAQELSQLRATHQSVQEHLSDTRSALARKDAHLARLNTELTTTTGAAEQTRAAHADELENLRVAHARSEGKFREFEAQLRQAQGELAIARSQRDERDAQLATRIAGKHTSHGQDGDTTVRMNKGGPTADTSVEGTSDRTGRATGSSSVHRKLAPRVQQRVRLYPRVRRSPAVGLPPPKRVRPQSRSVRPVHPVAMAEVSTGPEVEEQAERSGTPTSSPTRVVPATASDALKSTATADPDASTATAQTLSKQLAAIVQEHGAALRDLLQVDVAKAPAQVQDDSMGLHLDNTTEPQMIQDSAPSGSSLMCRFQDANEDSPHVSRFSSLDPLSALAQAHVARTSSPLHASSSGSLGLSQLPAQDDGMLDGSSGPDVNPKPEVPAGLSAPTTEGEHLASTSVEQATERAVTPTGSSAPTSASAPQPTGKLALRSLQSPARIPGGDRDREDEAIHADAETSTSDQELNLDQGSDAPSAPLFSPSSPMVVRSPELSTSRSLALRRSVHPRDRSHAPSASVDSSATSDTFGDPSSPSVLSSSVPATGQRNHRGSTHPGRSKRHRRSLKTTATTSYGSENVEPRRTRDHYGHATFLSRTSEGTTKESASSRSPLTESDLHNRLPSSPQTPRQQVLGTPPTVTTASTAGPPSTSATAGSAHDEAPSAPASSASRGWSVHNQASSSRGMTPRGSTPVPTASLPVPDAALAQLHALTPQESNLSSVPSFSIPRTPTNTPPSATPTQLAMEAITQAIIGMFMVKYTRLPRGIITLARSLSRGPAEDESGDDFGVIDASGSNDQVAPCPTTRHRNKWLERRHLRFIWLQPYTMTLYWSRGHPPQSPSQAASDAGQFKSAPIHAVRQEHAYDPDGALYGAPRIPGANDSFSLHNQSIVIVSSNGQELRLTAPSAEAHNTWLTALRFLVDRERMRARQVQDLPPLELPAAPSIGKLGASQPQVPTRGSSLPQQAPTLNPTPHLLTTPSPSRPSNDLSISEVSTSPKRWRMPWQRGSSSQSVTRPLSYAASPGVGVPSNVSSPEFVPPNRDPPQRRFSMLSPRLRTSTPVPEARPHTAMDLSPIDSDAATSFPDGPLSRSIPTPAEAGLHQHRQHRRHSSYWRPYSAQAISSEQMMRPAAAEAMIEEDDSGRSGLENVRVCCEGAHDVGHLCRKHATSTSTYSRHCASKRASSAMSMRRISLRASSALSMKRASGQHPTHQHRSSWSQDRYRSTFSLKMPDSQRNFSTQRSQRSPSPTSSAVPASPTTSFGTPTPTSPSTPVHRRIRRPNSTMSFSPSGPLGLRTTSPPSTLLERFPSLGAAGLRRSSASGFTHSRSSTTPDGGTRGTTMASNSPTYSASHPPLGGPIFELGPGYGEV